MISNQEVVTNYSQLEFKEMDLSKKHHFTINWIIRFHKLQNYRERIHNLQTVRLFVEYV